MDKDKFKHLINGYLNENLNEEELELLQIWYDSFDELETNVPGLENEQSSQALRDELYARIQQAIGNSTRIETKTRKRIGWKRVAVAAAITLAFSGTLWFATMQYAKSKTTEMLAQNHTFLEVKTGVKQVKKLALPDGSVIHVNSNSKIRISEHMDGDRREVYLEEGEAYFEVAQDTLRPFVIQVANLNVEVLGTAFNIRSYAELNDITVTVSHGKVRVNDNEHLLGDLIANEGMTYNKSERRAQLTNENASDARDWISGTIHLKKAEIKELAQALYNLYGVKLKSDDLRTEHHRYNISLRSDRTLEETMDVICNIHNTKYRRTGDEIMIYP